MKFYLPTTVYEETECVINHGTEITALGSHPLIVTGRHSAKACGALSDVCRVLEAAGQKYTIFDQVEENPSRETVMAGREEGLKDSCDYVIAIGGGSPMDAGKGMALMMANPAWGIEELYEKHENDRALPVVAIPTTCGTGSEVTGVAVLTRHDKKTKGSIPSKIYPAYALLDEKYLHSAPMQMLCDTAVDALAHLVESYMNAKATDFSRTFAKEGLTAWSRNKEVLSGKRPLMKEDYHNLLYASTMGGMAIAHTGTALPHAMSYPATYELSIPHGRACGYYLCGYLRVLGEEGRIMVPKMAGFSDVDEMETFLFEILHMDESDIPYEFRKETAMRMAVNRAKLKTSPISLEEKDLLVIARV